MNLMSKPKPEAAEVATDKGDRKADHWGLANRLREQYPSIFQTKKSAKQIVDAILAVAGDLLVEQGYLCLRGIGTIEVLDTYNRHEKKEGKTLVSQVRRRLKMKTSWVMLDRLNPQNPKRKK